jgi:CAAX prenyl protease-like protein
LLSVERNYQIKTQAGFGLASQVSAENRTVNSSPSSLRFSVIAYVAPFVLYVGTTMVENKSWFGIPHEYELLCTVKGVIVAVALWFFRKEYPPFAAKGWLLAIIAGIAGCVLWVALDWVQGVIPGLQGVINLVMQGGRAGFNPYQGDGPVELRITFVVVRLLEMAVIVPVMEELFWRGFLARYLLADDFRTAPQGVFTTFSFVAVTLAFTSVHPEVLAALAWGALINLLYRRTANLWACIVMHAVTNGVLGAYILVTGQWHLW